MSQLLGECVPRVDVVEVEVEVEVAVRFGGEVDDARTCDWPLVGIHQRT